MYRRLIYRHVYTIIANWVKFCERDVTTNKLERKAYIQKSKPKKCCIKVS